MDDLEKSVASLRSRISDLRKRLSLPNDTIEPVVKLVIEEEPKVQEAVYDDKEAERKKKSAELNAMKAKLLGGKKK